MFLLFFIILIEHPLLLIFSSDFYFQFFIILLAECFCHVVICYSNIYLFLIVNIIMSIRYFMIFLNFYWVLVVVFFLKKKKKYCDSVTKFTEILTKEMFKTSDDCLTPLVKRISLIRGSISLLEWTHAIIQNWCIFNRGTRAVCTKFLCRRKSQYLKWVNFDEWYTAVISHTTNNQCNANHLVRWWITEISIRSLTVNVRTFFSASF